MKQRFSKEISGDEIIDLIGMKREVFDIIRDSFIELGNGTKQVFVMHILSVEMIRGLEAMGEHYGVSVADMPHYDVLQNIADSLRMIASDILSANDNVRDFVIKNYNAAEDVVINKGL